MWQIKETLPFYALLAGLLIPPILCVLSIGPFELNVGIFLLVLAIGSFVMGDEWTGSKTKSVIGGIFLLLLGAGFLIEGIFKVIGR